MSAVRAIAGIVILALVIFAFRDSLTHILSANPEMFLLAVLSYTILNILLAYRIHYLLRKQGIDVRFFRILRLHYAGMIASDFTPGRAGYFAIPALARGYGIDGSAVLGVILSFQAVEMVVKILGASLAVFYLLTPSSYLGLVVPAILTLIAIAYLWSDIPPRIERLEEVRRRARMTKEHAPFIFSISLAGWVVVGFQWYFLFRALNMNVSFLQAFLLQPLATLLMFAPLTPAGMGIFESGSAFLISLLTGSVSQGVALSLLVRSSTILADLPGILEFLSKR
ncbi:lysylphosphatidylglycerol synthase transmembrane domain-containing protein [Geoglobus ahangari]|nr:lysylphosphatidylglycerol synthase transmembrane domain-containing protein [Geoglobus ahangari]